jgi:hypothetical protein
VVRVELSQAGEQIAHSPNGDELFEEIHGRESLLSHLAHWDGFEKDAIYSQGHVRFTLLISVRLEPCSHSAQHNTRTRTTAHAHNVAMRSRPRRWRGPPPRP